MISTDTLKGKAIASSKRNPCPICEKTHGCKISDNLVMCLRGDRNWSIPGWRYLKPLGGFMGGLFGADSGERREYRPEPKPAKPLNITPLTDKQLNNEAVKILKQLGLSTKHREQLRGRGLTDEQIDQRGFKSVDRYQEFNLIPINPNFPGMGDRGTLANSGSGILIPIRNIKGLIIGFQIARDDREPKYQWLLGSGERRVSGELPLQFLKLNDSNTLDIAEGTLKPPVAAHLHNINVLGAGGVNWHGSPNEFKGIIDSGLFTRYILNPDAGCKTNHHVMGAYRALHLFLKKLGVTLYIRDWGQGNQSKGEGLDVDEVDTETFNNAQIISYVEWDKHYLRELTEDWKKSAHQHWKRHKQFTPALTQNPNQQFTNFELNPIGSSLVIKAGLGTGKTHNIAEIIKRLPEDIGVIALFATNALALNFCERTGTKHLHRDNAFDELSKPNGRVALCTNSLVHFLNPDWFNNKLLIIDEVMTVVNHLVTSSTHKKNRKECMELFTQCLKRANRRIFLDGHVSDWVIDSYIQRLIGQHPVIKFENQYKSPRSEVEFLIGGQGSKSVKPNDSSAFIPAILSAPKLGLIIDSQIACEAWEELLKSVGKQGIRIDSKTVAVKKHPAKAFLSNPDKWINEFKPDYVILSPSGQCGIDISIRGYFTDVYSLFTGILTTDAQVQFIGRFRDPAIKHHVFCPEYTHKNQEQFNSPFASTIKKSVNEFLIQDIESITQNRDVLFNQLNQILNDNQQDNPHHDAWAILKSQENYEKANLRDCLLESMIESGYEVKKVLLETNKSSKVLLNETKEKIRRGNCDDYYHSKDITWLEAQQIAANWNASWEERASVVKASILDRLPGIERHPLWSPDFIYELIYGNRQMIASCELKYLLNNPEDAKRHQQNLWATVALGGDKFLPDIRSRHQIITALSELGVNTFLDPARTWYNSSPELLEIVRRGKRKKIRTALGFSPGVDPIKYLKRVFGLIGFELALKNQKRLNGSENPTRFYGIDQVKVNDPIRLAVSEAVKLRYSDESARAEFRVSKWDEFLKNINPEKIPLTTDIPRIEPVSDQPNILINLGLSVTSEKAKTESKRPVAVVEKCYEPEPDPDPQSWKGIMGRIKPEIAPYWLEVYTIYKESNPLTRSGARVKSVDNAPTWKHNAMAPNDGGWALLVEIEGLIGTKINVPIDCLEFEGI